MILWLSSVVTNTGLKLRQACGPSVILCGVQNKILTEGDLEQNPGVGEWGNAGGSIGNSSSGVQHQFVCLFFSSKCNGHCSLFFILISERLNNNWARSLHYVLRSLKSCCLTGEKGTKPQWIKQLQTILNSTSRIWTKLRECTRPTLEWSFKWRQRTWQRRGNDSKYKN